MWCCVDNNMALPGRISSDEVIVMTASKRGLTGEENVVRIDRLVKTAVNEKTMHYAAEGPFKGILINKAARSLVPVGNPHVRMEFTACLLTKTDKSTPETRERRELRYWFKVGTDRDVQMAAAKEYFKQLIKPETFPRDYVSFIKKAILLMTNFPLLRRLEVILKPTPPPPPPKEEPKPVPVVMKKPPSPKPVPKPVVVKKPTPPPPKPPPAPAPKLFTPPPPPPPPKVVVPPTPPPPEPEPEPEEPAVENFITVLTPTVYDYQYLPEVPVSNKRFLTFRIKAKADAHLALSSVYGDTERKTFEIVIGASGNSKSVIRDGGEGKTMQEALTLNILNGSEYRPFWINWSKNVLEVGEGKRKGRGTFLQWDIPKEKQHVINCLAVSTGPGSDGEWEFVELLHPPEPESNTKCARRAKVRIAILWAAKKEKMLQVLEEVYPNNLQTDVLLKLCNIRMGDMMTAVIILKDLQGKGLITEVSRGLWMRAPKSKQDTKHEIRVVNDMPYFNSTDEPSIAVVTSLYVEKIAVDSMLTNKISYVKYKSGGEAHVYTLGRIGAHSVVVVKVPIPKGAEAAAIAAENCISKLIGTFGRLEHCFVVGVGGAVPNFTDYRKHVRLGDIAVSLAKKDDPLYIHCEKANKSDDGFDYCTRIWMSGDNVLQGYVEQIKKLHVTDPSFTPPWEQYLEEAQDMFVAEETNFHRPPSKSDRLFGLLDGELVLLEHPKPEAGEEGKYREHDTHLRYGAIGTSKYVARSDLLRMDFAGETGIVAYDYGFQTVLDTLCGSKCDSFCLIRGISDYVDGHKDREWQPYAALCAAAYMKTIINAMAAKKRSRYSLGY